KLLRFSKNLNVIESAAQKPRQHRRRGLIDLTYFSEGRLHEVDGSAVV
ncbi:hypothetical protein ALC56_08640, partial [Trachymyrmex septentrionalis]